MGEDANKIMDDIMNERFSPSMEWDAIDMRLINMHNFLHKATKSDDPMSTEEYRYAVAIMRHLTKELKKEE